MTTTPTEAEILDEMAAEIEAAIVRARRRLRRLAGLPGHVKWSEIRRQKGAPPSDAEPK